MSKLERKILIELKKLDELDPFVNRIEYNSRLNHLRKLNNRYNKMFRQDYPLYEPLNVLERVYSD